MVDDTIRRRASRPVEAVFFDLYGTLVVFDDMTASWDSWLATLHDSMVELGFHIGTEDLAERCADFFGRAEPEQRWPDLTVFEHRLLELCSELGVDVAAEQARLLADRAAAAWHGHAAPAPDARSTLSALGTEFPLALVSNFDHPRAARALLRRFGLDGFFATITISGEVGVSKPDPGIFSEALEQLGVAPEAVAFVGDSPEDVEAATAAGMWPITIVREPIGNGPAARSAVRHDAAPRPGSEVTTITSLGRLTSLFAPE